MHLQPLCPANPCREILAGGEQVDIPKDPGKEFVDTDDGGGRREILVGLAIFGFRCELVMVTRSQPDRADHDPFGKLIPVSTPATQHDTVTGRSEQRSCQRLFDLAQGIRHC